MPATTEMRISDLNTASILDESDLLEISKVNGTSASGYMSYKTTLFAIALYVTKLANYTSDLQTTNKTVIGAINELKQLISLIPRFSIEVVETLPTEDISVSTLYLVPSSDPETGNYYEEYIYVDNAWEMVGTTAVDLSDYYTKTQVDNLLNNKVDKVSGKGLSTNDFVNTAKYPDLTAGKSLSLVTKTYGVEANDSAPYVFRQFPASVINSKLEKLKKIIGASVVWNQLVKNGNFADTANWSAIRCTLSVANNEGTCTVSELGSIRMYQRISYQNGHRYLISFSVKGSTNNFITVSANADALTTKTIINEMAISNNYTKVSLVFTGTGESNENALTIGYKTVNVPSIGETLTLKNVMITDLTSMFGSTIADYVYSLEQNQAGSGIAWLKSYGFFAEDYYTYSANTIQSVSVSKHITKDSDSQTLTETNLDHTELRGLFKLDANNNLYADGDVYPSDGSGEVKYGIVDLGTIVDTTTGNVGSDGLMAFKGNNVGIKVPSASTEVAKILCGKYITSSRTGQTTGQISVNTSGNIIVCDTSYAGTARSELPTIFSGVYLVFEKATPTTATLTPFNPLSVIEQGGTEEFVDYQVSQSNRDVSIPAGTDTDFYEEVETVMPLPNVPFEDGTYMLTAEVEDNEPVFKFARITT